MPRPAQLVAVLVLVLGARALVAQPAEGTLRATFDAGSRALTLLWAAGPAIDELRLIVPPRLAERLHPVDFPDGWYLRREAGSLTLAGPAAEPPVRFRLALGEGAAPRTVAVEVRSADHPVFASDDLPVLPAPAPTSKIEGLLLLPPVVSPGERVLLQVLDRERTPLAGTWRLAGVAAAPYDPRVSAFDAERARRLELAMTGGAGAPAPRSQELARLAAALAAEDAARTRRYAVRPLAAADLEAGAAIEEEEFAVEELPLEEEAGEEEAVTGETVETEPEPPAAVAEPATGEPEPLRGLEHATAYAVVPVAAADFGLDDDPGAAVFAIARREGADLLADVGPGEEGVRLYAVAEATAAGGAPERVFAVAPTLGAGEPAGRFLAVVPTSAGGRLAFDVAPVEKLPPPPAPELLATLLTADLPPELAPGGALPVTYTDPTGEVTVDVAAAGGVAIAPPGRRQGPPRLDAAAAYALAGTPLCLCGRFPSPRAWRGLTLDTTPATPAAASGWSAWLLLPTSLEPGKHVLSGLPALGFPAGRELAFEAIAVELQLDEPRLLAGEPAPLAVRILGTEDPLAIRLRNRTPDRASLDGGDLQTLTTSGGEDNTATLTVRPRRRGGPPDLSWELAPAPCPCAPHPDSSLRSE
jgi:hypothetical protein